MHCIITAHFEESMSMLEAVKPRRIEVKKTRSAPLRALASQLDRVRGSESVNGLETIGVSVRHDDLQGRLSGLDERIRPELNLHCGPPTPVSYTHLRAHET